MGLALDCGARLKEGALVARVLRGKTDRDGLRAFKPAAGIEECAVHARVEVAAAPGTPRVGRDIGRFQHVAAAPAAGHVAKTGHVRRPRLARTAFALPGSGGGLRRLALLSIAWIVLIASLAIFAVRRHWTAADFRLQTTGHTRLRATGCRPRAQLTGCRLRATQATGFQTTGYTRLRGYVLLASGVSGSVIPEACSPVIPEVCSPKPGVY